MWQIAIVLHERVMDASHFQFCMDAFGNTFLDSMEHFLEQKSVRSTLQLLPNGITIDLLEHNVMSKATSE